MSETLLALLIHSVIVLSLIARVLLRPHREPASRIAWIVVIVTIPVAGIFLYLFFGEINIGRRRVERLNRALQELPPPGEAASTVDQEGSRAEVPEPEIPQRYDHLFRVAESISGFAPVGGNTATLMHDSNATIESMVADIDAAKRHIHLIFYIWLEDNNGRRMIDALKRAAARGVVCRAMVDGLGSRPLIRSSKWAELRDAGVHVAVALPIGNPLVRPLVSRVDLRNHRKVLVIDSEIAYCGSQNCADPEFRVKPRYAPWVDTVIRLQGPIAKQHQYVFASDWMTYVDEDLSEIVSEPVAYHEGGFPAAMVATGPTIRYSAMAEMFESLMHAARRELIITSPYYVPNESLQDTLCATAYRGVETTVIFPARNDSKVVAAASHSYYADLLTAGVRIREYRKGLLHAKTLTLDGEVTLIGSANLDRRSFELNYENNILLVDRELTEKIRERQMSFLQDSDEVTLDQVNRWPVSRRLFNNTVAMLGPVL